jgi:hypothetical protein
MKTCTTRLLLRTLALCALLAPAALPAAETITLAWDPPETNTDGSPIDNIGGYVLNVGAQPGGVDRALDVGLVTQAAVDGLEQGQTYFFSVVCYNTGGGSSDPSPILDWTCPVNQAPAVSAGPDQAIRWPLATAELAGTSSDDGLPTGSALSAAWSVVSADGAVSFTDANALTTAVTIGGEGEYVFRLTVSDGEHTVSDDVALTVLPPLRPSPPQGVRIVPNP